jgi:hypothetical protein
VVPSLPSARLSSRSLIRHCGRGALKCDDCLGALALCLATELNFEAHAAAAMSPAWFLAQLLPQRASSPGTPVLGAGLECDVRAQELAALTVGISRGLERITSGGEPVEETPEASLVLPRTQFHALFWLTAGLAGCLVFVLCLVGIIAIVWGS